MTNRDRLNELANSKKYYLDISNENNISKIRNADCNEEIIVMIQNDNNIITNVKWFGNGCSIMKASAEALSNSIINKNINDATKLLEEYNKYIQGIINEIIPELEVFEILRTHKSRIKCSKIVSDAMINNLRGQYD